MGKDELSGDELVFHRLSLSGLVVFEFPFLHLYLSLFLLRRSLPQQLATQSVFAAQSFC